MFIILDQVCLIPNVVSIFIYCIKDFQFQTNSLYRSVITLFNKTLFKAKIYIIITQYYDILTKHKGCKNKTLSYKV
jgi:hypothetical protein